MTMDEAAADEDLFFKKALPFLARPNKSKFRDVFPVGKRWQAKPYIRPGVQRDMGMYGTPEEAAVQVLLYLCTGIALPSPKKKRNKRGTGRQPRPKR